MWGTVASLGGVQTKPGEVISDGDIKMTEIFVECFSRNVFFKCTHLVAIAITFSDIWKLQFMSIISTKNISKDSV